LINGNKPEKRKILENFKNKLFLRDKKIYPIYNDINTTSKLYKIIIS